MPTTRVVVRLLTAALLAIAGGARAVLAQSGPPTWNVTVKRSTAGRVEFSSQELKSDAKTPLQQSSATLHLTCEPPNVDCQDVVARVLVPDANARTVASFGESTPTKRTLRVVRSAFRPTAEGAFVDGTLVIAHGTDSVAYAIGAAGAATPATPATGGTTMRPGSLNELLRSPACLDKEPEGSGGEFVVSATGAVIARPSRPVNESQRVRVVVYADERLVPLLQAERRSPFRPVRLNNIISGQVTMPRLPSATDPGRQAIGDEEERPPQCRLREFEVADLAPGRGVVELTALTDQGREVTGTFDFTVNELYTGAFTLGASRTTAQDSRFGTTTVRRDTIINGAATTVSDTVVTITEDRGDRLLYVLSYTPFIWGERDPKVRPDRWIERINPTVGIAVNDVSNNGFLGISVDLSNRIYGTWGVHAARVTELDPSSAQVVGGRVGSTPVATAKRWTFRTFYGISVDLQAGVDLLQKVIGGGTGGS